MFSIYKNRTNTYPKLPERYRLRNSDGGAYTAQMSAQQRNLYGGSSSSTPTTPPPTVLSAGQTLQQHPPPQPQHQQGTRVEDQDQNQEEIYF